MAVTANNRLLSDWMSRIADRSLVLPRFQRHEAWTPNNVAELFNSVLNDHPLGMALVLAIDGEEPFISRRAAVIFVATSSRSLDAPVYPNASMKRFGLIRRVSLRTGSGCDASIGPS